LSKIPEKELTNSYSKEAEDFDWVMSFFVIAFFTAPLWLFVLGLGLFLVESGLQALQSAGLF